MVKTSAPGFYRIMLGDLEITALSDGTVALPVEKMARDDLQRRLSAIATLEGATDKARQGDH